MAASSTKETLDAMISTLSYFKERGLCETFHPEYEGYGPDDTCLTMFYHLEAHVERLKKKYKKENQVFDAQHSKPVEGVKSELRRILDDLYQRLDDTEDDTEIQTEIETIIDQLNRLCPE